MWSCGVKTGSGTVYMYENYYEIVKKAMRLGLMIKTTALLVDHTLAHFFGILLQPQHETP